MINTQTLVFTANRACSEERLGKVIVCRLIEKIWPKIEKLVGRAEEIRQRRLGRGKNIGCRRCGFPGSIVSKLRTSDTDKSTRLAFQLPSFAISPSWTGIAISRGYPLSCPVPVTLRIFRLAFFSSVSSKDCNY